MATSYPRYTYIISRTLDPLFALVIGISAAGIRIRREENEKRAGLPTTSIVPPQEDLPKEERREVGFGEIARIGWGRLRRRMSGEEGEVEG
ncbi:hypothetical protein ACLMJK_002067 [Lecanora helva]